MYKYFLMLVTTVVVSFPCSAATHKASARIALLEEIEYIEVYCNTEQATQLLSQETENQDNTTEQNSDPEYLYKIISKEQWQESLLKNQIILSASDKDFIHLAKKDQIANIVQKFWNNMDHIILKLAAKNLMGHLVYETNPRGTTKYYHLYDGTIPLEAVKDVTIVHITKRGL